MTKRLSDRVAFISGASSGFGEAIALTFAREGCAVALSARRADRLEALAQRIDADGKAAVFVADFTQEAQVQASVRAAEAEFGKIDILINNAGVMFLEPIEEADLARWRSMIELNLIGLIAATQAVLPGMRARKDGHIVNISSTAGRSGPANGAGYSATKFGVVGFTESLRRETYKDHIRATVIEPGLADTELRDHVAHPAARTAIMARAASMRQLTAQDVANAVLYAISQPPHVCIDEILMRPMDQDR